MLAIAYDESRLTHGLRGEYAGIGQISKRLWGAELKKHGIPIDSLRAIEYVYLKVGLKQYKGSIKNMKSYNRTMKIYKRISNGRK